MADPETMTLTRSSDGSEGEIQLADQLFVVLHADRPLQAPSRHVLSGIDEVVFGRGADVEVVRKGRRLDVRVPDRRVSGQHARLERLGAGWALSDLGSKNGTFVGAQACGEKQRLADGSVFSIGHTFLMLGEARPAPGLADLVAGGGVRTLSATLGDRFAAVAKVSQTDTAVLVLGESGTGKERVARALHDMAGRRGDFVALNCGAVPPTLLPSELFGHKRGAFSGADADRTGVVVTASGGTLLLDEIGDLPLEVQPALLRVLQEREVTPLGAARPTAVDLRVVSATHRDLAADVEAGRFRRDLYARIAGFTLALPPLRDRREDLGLVVADLLRRHAREPEAIALSHTSSLALFRHPWRQNIRELENALKVALALDDGQPLRLELAADPPAGAPAPADRDERRADELRRLLGEHRGNVAAVARALGKQRTLVHRWLRELGIDPDSFR